MLVQRRIHNLRSHIHLKSNNYEIAKRRDLHDEVAESTLEWLCKLDLRSAELSSWFDCTLRRREEAVAVSNCWRVCSCMILFGNVVSTSRSQCVCNGNDGSMSRHTFGKSSWRSQSHLGWSGRGQSGKETVGRRQKIEWRRTL
jgi:hypothetical protein